MTGEPKTHYEVIVVGAGVAGIYQIKRLAEDAPCPVSMVRLPSLSAF